MMGGGAESTLLFVLADHRFLAFTADQTSVWLGPGIKEEGAIDRSRGAIGLMAVY